MNTRRLQLRKRPEAHVAAVVPAYNVSRELGDVLRQMPPIVKTIVVVDDASRDDTAAVAERYAQLDPRLIVVRHETNRGVGGAMVTGFGKALEAGADVVVKVDGDGQMPLWFVPQLVQPLVDGTADYTKGNRFRDFQAIRAMPMIRRSRHPRSRPGNWRITRPMFRFDVSPEYRAGIGTSFTTAPRT